MSDQDRVEGGTQNDKRRAARISVLRRVKITFSKSGRPDSAIDSLGVSSSPTGVRVRTAVMVEIPEWVTLEFSDGSTVRAQRRWARGVEIGFELTATNS